MQARGLKRSGFTLIELLVVISIISLLASVVLASLNVARSRASLSAAKRASLSFDNVLGAQAAGMWDFDECTGTSTADKSGEGRTGAISSGSLWTTNTPNNTGCALAFTGTQNMQVNPGIDATVFTMAAWFKTSNGAQNTYRTFISKQLSVSSNRNYWFGLSGATDAVHCGYGRVIILYSVSGSSDAGHACSNARYDDDQWHFAIATYNGTVLKMYVDGIFQNQQTIAAPDQQTAPTVFGIYSDLSGNAFTGSLDGIRILTTPFSLSQVEKLYAEGLPDHRFATNE